LSSLFIFNTISVSISADSIYLLTGLIIFIAYSLLLFISLHPRTLPKVPSHINSIIWYLSFNISPILYL